MRLSTLVAPLNTIVGNFIDEATGQPVRKRGVSVMLFRTNTGAPNSGRTTPALQFTDDHGLFAFDSLAPGISEVNLIDVQWSGKLTVRHDDPGTFVIDANIAVADVPTFEITKNSNKRIVEIGGVVSYDVEVRNTSADRLLSRVWLVDELPSAFVFAKGSAYRNEEQLLDPTDNRHVRWFIADSLLPGGVVKVTYSVTVGAGALESNGINKAYAVATLLNGDTSRTAVASVQVVVRPGIFTDRGIVIGKVFYDENENAKQDEGEQGIAGVELWMEDGTRILTGDDGKYSLPEVRPGQHVMRVNDRTLQYGSKLLALTSEFAGDGLTRFIRLTEGGIARTDFYVKPPNQAALDVMYAQATAPSIGVRIPATYIIKLYEIGSPNNVSLLDTLPPGFYFDLNSITWQNMKLYPQGAYSRSLWVDLQKRPAQSCDTLQVSIVADSLAFGKTLVSNGRLVLTYPHAKDAVFAARQIYGVVEESKPESGIVSATTETLSETTNVKQSEVTQAPNDTLKEALNDSPKDIVVHEASVVDTVRHGIVAEKKHTRKRTGGKRVASTDTPDVKKPHAVAQPSVQEGVPGLVVESSTDTNVESAKEGWNIIPLVGLAAIGILYALVILFLFRRRKRKGDHS